MTSTTSLLNGLSSLSAYALANPQAEAIAALVTVGVAGAATLVTISFKEWKAYESKKHKAKLDAINALHQHFLKNLVAPGGAQVPGLPQIFQFDAEGKTVSSLHYNDDEINDIGRVLPQDPAELARYREYVRDAILRLKEYYFATKSSDDVTRGVISYILNILQNRCLSFVGYDYDITYLHAIIAFINHYASQEGTTKSIHFDRLKKVFSSLTFAVQDLEKHKETMSLLGLVNQTRSTCQETSDELLRLQVKLITPKKYQHIVDTVTLDDLSKDILREKYISHELWGIALSSHKEITLPKSIFHNWIMGMAKYYLQSLTPQTILQQIERVMRPEELYEFINGSRAILKQRVLAKADHRLAKPSKADKKKVEDGLTLIHKVFENAPNFISTKLDESEKDPQFITIKDNEELLDASEILADLAHLNHVIISMQTLSAALTKNMEELGLDFFDNQNNFNKIFTAFNTLYKIIQTDLSKIKQKLTEISVANKNTARLADEMWLETELNRLLQKVEANVLQAAEKVKNYKNKHPKTEEASRQEVLSAAEFFQTMYAPLIQPPALNPPVVEEAPQPAPAITVPTEPQPTLSTVKEKIAVLNGLRTNLDRELQNILHSREPDPQAAAFQRIFNSLKGLHIKSVDLLNEPNQSNERLLKSGQIYQLTASLYHDVIEFFALTADDRAHEADKFIKEIHTQINKLETKTCIDRHHNSVRKFIFENFGFFPTITHERVAEIQLACESLKRG